MKIFVCDNDHSVKQMWREAGHTIEMNFDRDFDVMCFTGGQDINPHLYGERLIQGTYPSLTRDDQEVRFWRRVPPKFPKVGICRGAQLGNVLCGGTLWQDVDRHANVREHDCRIETTGKIVKVNTIHHQMCQLTNEVKLLATAREATFKRSEFEFTRLNSNDWTDPEAFYYDNFHFLGVQFHPEYHHAGANKLFFDLFEEYYG